MLRKKRIVLIICFIPIFLWLMYLLSLVWAVKRTVKPKLRDAYDLSQFDTSNPINLYFSLTTVPDRIANVDKVIYNLLSSSESTGIFVNIPHISKKHAMKYKIPHFLENTGNRIQILRTIDWGPATKIIPTIKYLKSVNKNNVPVIVVDDDQIYPTNIVDEYLKWHRYMNSSSFTLRGHKYNGNWNNIVGGIMHSYEVHDLDCVDIITGVGTYLVTPSMFDEKLWVDLINDHGDLQSFADADDIWISGQLAKNKVDRYIIPGRDKEIDVDNITEEEYLKHITIKPWAWNNSPNSVPLNGGKDESNDALLKMFDNSWSCKGWKRSMVSCKIFTSKNYPAPCL